ncbi:MAG: hypothetical protein H5U25_05560 [Oceanibaculum nanhaiense]|nr:hypothetical protein [Oceanibaculum nanhaiense]
MTLDAETVFGLMQVGLLAGIFYRLGAVRGEIEGVKDRVQKLERAMS